MKWIMPLLFILLFSEVGSAQYWMQFGGGITIDEGMDVDADGNGNIYATGYFTNSASFLGVPAVASAGLDDIFIVKADSNGIIKWMRSAGGINIDKALSVDVDVAGNVVVTGYFYASSQFGSQTIISAGQQDMFVAKYDTQGNLLWVKSAGGTGSDIGNGVSFDNAGNVIVTGEFAGTCSFGSLSLTSQASSIDVFTVKYSSAGNELWAKKGSGPLTDRGMKIATDNSNNIYVSGMFSDTATFDQVHNNTMYNAVFLIKYNSIGQEQWFRWMGSSNAVNLGGLDLNADKITVAGDLKGTLFFLGGTGLPSLSTTQSNNIFISRYDTSGAFTWSKAEGSSSDVSATCVTTKASGEAIVAGNFKCRFTDYSSRYGDGIFCSIGYADSYVALYDNSGVWQWARHYGGRQEDFVKGICHSSNGKISTCGSFNDVFYSTINPGNYSGYQTANYCQSGSYCTDNNYYCYASKSSLGNSDAYINTNIDLSRQPLDYFNRDGSSCLRPMSMCISNSNLFGVCPDSVEDCFSVSVGVNGFLSFIKPSFQYLWSDGTSFGSLQTNSTGNYSLTMTTDDGCFSFTDSITAIVNPLPPSPPISDSKGVNTNTFSPLKIVMCKGDSVQIWIVNSFGNTVQWNNAPLGQDTIKVGSSGFYTCTLVNSFGCLASTTVQVEVFDPLFSTIPKLLCVEDLKDSVPKNDTISICDGSYFQVFIYDSLRYPNPIKADSCFPGMTSAKWKSNKDSLVSYTKTTACSPYSTNVFYPHDTGIFDIEISVWIYRTGPCGKDSIFVTKSFHVTVNPKPPSGSLSINITGPNMLCPGDTIVLVASGGNDFSWNPGFSNNDSLFVKSPGSYSVSSADTITNSFGCSTIIMGFASTSVNSYPQPTIISVPSSGLICPNDSVLLVCLNSGTYEWYGPNGAINVNNDSVYVQTPGTYFCVQTTDSICTLVSNSVQVFQYATPSLIAAPFSEICPGGTVTLIVITNDGSQITWLPPLTGSSLTQSIFAPGTYSCSVLSCGIVTNLSLTITGDTAEAVIFPTDTMIEFCEGDSVLLTANAGMSKYLWLPSGDTTMSAYFYSPGIQTLHTTSLSGCTDFASVTLVEKANTLLPPLVADTTICNGLPVALMATGNDTIYWCYSLSINDTLHTGSSLFIPQVKKPTTYYLFTKEGVCKSAFDSVRVFVDNDCHDVFISNVITPNNDGVNDFFPEPSSNYVIDLKIFNRWGKLVFETNHDSASWNGKDNQGNELEDGTYYYVLAVSFPDEFVKSFQGHIMVLGN